MALVTIIGGDNSDSHVSVSEYHTYILNTYNVDISSGPLAADESNVRRATSILDISYLWKGYLVSDTQNLLWPRKLYNYGYTAGSYQEGGYIGRREKFEPSSQTPQRIKDAVCELAYLIRQGLDVVPTIEGGTVKSESLGAGPAQIKTVFSNVYAAPRIIIIERLIAPFHDGPVGATTSRVTRG